MASAVKNNATVLTRGRPVNLGSVTAAGDVVQFSLPDGSYQYGANLLIQAVGGVTPVFALEISIDGGATWEVYPTAQTTGFVNVFTLTGQPGGDAAAKFAAQYNVAGLGAGCSFRFGRTDATGGASAVWCLIG